MFEGDPTGLQSPQINREQAGTGDDRSFSSSSPSHGVGTEDVGKLLKPTPTWIPFFEPPDCFHQQRAHAPITLPINAAQFLSGPGAVFARTTTDVAADLLSIGEAMPIDRFTL